MRHLTRIHRLTCGGDCKADHTLAVNMADKSDEEVEDYDFLKIDPDTLVHGSQGGFNDRRASLDDRVKPTPRQQQGRIRRSSESSVSDGGRRRLQMRLEKTEEAGRYILTADDEEVQEILKMGMAREQAASGASTRLRIRDLVFTRQFTTFDRQNPLSADTPFHGFFTLFWLAMVLMFLKVAAANWRQYGSILGNNEIMILMFRRDVVVLGLVDVAMLLSTSTGLILQKIILRGYIKWATSGWIIQNVWQSFFLGSILWWIYWRDWPWTHTIFMILHTMVFLMKQHSYAFYNGHLSGIHRRREMLQRKLHQLGDKGIFTNGVNGNHQEAKSSAVGTLNGGVVTSRHDRPPMGVRTSTNMNEEVSDVAKVSKAIESGKALDVGQIEAFKRVILAEIESLDIELRGKSSSEDNAYPKNLNWRNFVEWTCLPTLVYELEYPRLEKINWWYVAEKTAATFGTIGVMMVISQAYIYPPVAQASRLRQTGKLQERWNELPWLVSDMLFPLLLEQLLSWYVIWECVLNVLAEVTRFADRGFYGPWWNSVSFESYSRDWNRPVHNFLLKHVYNSSISTFHLSKKSATFITFLLSALVHELVMACLFKTFRGYLFALQLSQIPLVSFSRSKFMKGRDMLGNVIFWTGLFIGPSLLTALYLLI
ncbi:hypothetical protein K461DRAFT_326047 [Myriangium duriaei CBS 260.36]|uniref:O-acyltransferase n=1 Tax=Myriangium duriaei CBS 260.36 TaxID=1168546 RepID=A0A9P4JF19_9PEZI|nr:hypothetical protein K461DRAFT_326047 [Myriangium duriaei CBS 260.36]